MKTFIKPLVTLASVALVAGSLTGCVTKPYVDGQYEQNGNIIGSHKLRTAIKPEVGEELRLRKLCKHWKMKTCDAGITIDGNNYTFEPQVNEGLNPGQTLAQAYANRSEMKTGDIRSDFDGKIVLETTWSMVAEKEPEYRAHRFTGFQIHGRQIGGPPPLQVEITEDRIRFISAYLEYDPSRMAEDGPGMLHRHDGSMEVVLPEDFDVFGHFGYMGALVALKRDGTEYDLRLEYDFAGNEYGDFVATMFVDGKEILKGYYKGSRDERFQRYATYHFKTGVYARNNFDYKLTQRNLRIYRAE